MERLRHDLFLRLQSALRVLPKPRHLLGGTRGAGDPQRLARMMLELQQKGCHNINFVTPEHVVPQILEALPYAIDAGLRLPIVYNTSAYDSLDGLALMDGIIDIYMPDAKVWTRDRARRLLRMPDYPRRCAQPSRRWPGRWGSWSWTTTGWRCVACWCVTW
ncbi:putative pyruvate formate lyase activating enzyme [Mycobacterium xenopi 4042]|uniref:Putative pyruvate formate lyase activating enzyme n=1 Tax=Mycobacterium xenopi 4042 TaxID=1299334 RepID=X8DX70_MYCXE|nr:putative pyruvate formate lyase activating enzyme [Mycobacterium xenopi 4042]